MISHAPPDYGCPFCALLARTPAGELASEGSDIIYQTGQAAAFISSRQYPANPGNTLVVPRQHYENLYMVPPALLGEVHALAQRIARAQKAAYGCDGVSLRQHNEPAGGQDVWHYHVHVTPRYAGDGFYETFTNSGRNMPPEERAEHARRIRQAMENIQW